MSVEIATVTIAALIFPSNLSQVHPQGGVPEIKVRGQGSKVKLIENYLRFNCNSFRKHSTDIKRHAYKICQVLLKYVVVMATVVKGHVMVGKCIVLKCT